MVLSEKNICRPRRRRRGGVTVVECYRRKLCRDGNIIRPGHVAAGAWGWGGEGETFLNFFISSKLYSASTGSIPSPKKDLKLAFEAQLAQKGRCC